MKPNISVVVPVYHVEKYLRKCVDSILHQSFKNFELILVDDGSNDICAEICDEYQENFVNVSTYHKANGGLSDARNYGVMKAKADYIVFVDSDDYVEQDYLQYLWTLHLETGSELCVSGIIKEKENGIVLDTFSISKETIMNNIEAIEAMCYGKEVPIFAYAKLYPKTVLIANPYPIGKLHEDVWTTYLLFDNVEKITVGNQCHYHYIMHKGSILHSKFSNKFLDATQGAKNILIYLENKYPSIVNAGIARCLIEGNALLHRAAFSAEYSHVAGYVKSLLAGYWVSGLTNYDLAIKIRLELMLFYLSPTIYKKLYQLFAKTFNRSGD